MSEVGGMHTEEPIDKTGRFPFVLLAIVLFSFFFAASTPSPLFIVFQRHWGFSSAMLTIAFSAYAVTLLAALLSAGALSDHIGRRPVIIGALVLQTGAMVMFALSDNIYHIIIARCVQGLATGIASGALSAAVVESAPAGGKKLGALFTSVAPLAGLAFGSFVTGISMSWLGSPEVTVFATLATAFTVAAIAVTVVPETATKRAGALKSLIPRISVAHSARVPFVRFLPILLVIWGLCGLYMSLGPSILNSVFKVDSAGLNGLTVAALCWPAAIAAAVMGRLLSPGLCSLLGTLALAAGLGILVVSLAGGGIVIFFIGTLIAGIGSGAGFSSVLQTLAPLAHPHERAELFAAIFVATYLSLSIPPIIAGFGVAVYGLLNVSYAYFSVLLIVALIKAWELWRIYKSGTVEHAR